jgi:hypothetical protein
MYNRFTIETAVMVLKTVLKLSIYNQFKIGNWSDGFENRFKTINNLKLRGLFQNDCLDHLIRSRLIEMIKDTSSSVG